MAHPIGLLFSGAGKVAKGGFKLAGAGAAGKMALGAGIGGTVGAFQGYDANSRLEGFAKGALLGATGGAAVAFGPRIAMATAKGGYRGGKFLWSANATAGRRAAEKRARTLAFGDAKGIGPLPRDLEPSMLQTASASPFGRMARGAGRAGMFALDHPFLTAGVVGGGYLAVTGAGTGQPMSSPGLEGARANVSLNKQAIMTAELGQIGMGTIGSADQMRGQFQYADWMASTGKFMSRNSHMGRLADSTVGLPQGLHAGRHG